MADTSGGMTIPQNISVDNVTLEKNGAGELQIKAGGLGASHISLTNDYIYDDVNGNIYKTISDGSYAPFPIGDTIFHQKPSATFTIDTSFPTTNLRFYVEIAGHTGTSSTTTLEIRKNGTPILTFTTTSGSYVVKKGDISVTAGDVITYWVKASNSSGAFYLKNCRILGLSTTPQTVNFYEKYNVGNVS